jgi:peptidoglycan/xylan/chitin deacetylase (PgdA/CDA1 family)
MLTCLMYHSVGKRHKHGNDEDTFKRHLEIIKKKYNCVLPGELLNASKPNVCLTFDDGYFDFYVVVYPILQELGLKALLAISPSFLIDKCDIDATQRLGYTYKECYSLSSQGAFCTLEELKIMLKSGVLAIASHGFTHIDLTGQGVNLDFELKESRDFLQEKLGVSVDAIVYPYGKCNETTIQEATKYYKYQFRIGSYLNRSWDENVLGRLNADNLQRGDEPFSFLTMTAAALKGFVAHAKKS